MKINWNKKHVSIIRDYILIAIIYFVFIAVVEIDGKYALFTKGFWTGLLLFYGIIIGRGALRIAAEIKSKNKKLVIIIVIVTSLYLFSYYCKGEGIYPT